MPNPLFSIQNLDMRTNRQSPNLADSKPTQHVLVDQVVDYQGNFLDLLQAHSIQLQFGQNNSDGVNTALLTRLSGLGSAVTMANPPEQSLTEGTTVVAVRYQDGVMVAGDRRATAGNVVMHDRADKVLEIDEYSVMAIAGAPAVAYEMARTLEHSFQYFRRSQLQELSIEGKIRMVSRLIRDNMSLALQGIGGVIPIFALFDPSYLADSSASTSAGRIFFYDVLGAQFETVDFATSGSGSVWIRGVLHYLDRWSDTPLAQMDLSQATNTILRLLDTAAEFDAATSGANVKSEIYPIIKTITQEGVQGLPAEQVRQTYQNAVLSRTMA